MLVKTPRAIVIDVSPEESKHRLSPVHTFRSRREAICTIPGSLPTSQQQIDNIHSHELAVEQHVMKLGGFGFEDGHLRAQLEVLLLQQARPHRYLLLLHPSRVT